MGRAKGRARPRCVRRLGCVATAALAVALIASPVAGFDARVGWGPVQNVAGYRLYIRQIGQPYGAAIDVGPLAPVSGVVRYVARSLPSGIANFFSVSSYDAVGRESSRSNELSLVVGTPVATTAPTRTPTLRSATASPTRPPIPPTGSQSSTPTLGPNTTATAVFTPTAAPLDRRRVRFKKTRATQGTTVSVPVKISAGSGVRFVTMVATYDPEVVVAGPVNLSLDAGGGSVTANLSTPGTLSVSAALVEPMTASGLLFEVPFTAVGPCRSRTDIEITSCVLDGGAVACRTRNGRIRVRCR